MTRSNLTRNFALALTLLVASTSAMAADAAKEKSHDGKVVKTTDNLLVMKAKDGQEHSHSLAKDAKVTLDGKACKLADLSPGTKIRVTLETADEKLATRIEAIEKNETFANTHDGKLVSMSKGQFVMSGADGQEHRHVLAEQAEVTCDGKPCKLSDLKAGMKIRVTTKESDEGTAINIEALDKDVNFV